MAAVDGNGESACAVCVTDSNYDVYLYRMGEGKVPENTIEIGKIENLPFRKYVICYLNGRFLVL